MHKDNKEATLFRTSVIQWAIVAGHSLTGMLIGTFAPEVFSVELTSTAEMIYFGGITVGFVFGTILASRCSHVKTLRWIAMAQFFVAAVPDLIYYLGSLGSLGEDPYDFFASSFRHYVYTSLVICFAALLVVGSYICWTRLIRRQFKDSG